MTESHPTIPAQGSGITIGIGYDLGQVSPEQFETDWGGLLPPDIMNRLLSYVHNTNPTQIDLAAVSDINISWDNSVREFEDKTLPQVVQETRTVYQQLDDLPPKSQAALVSLVYNRGPNLKDQRGYLPKGDMRGIQADLQTGQQTNIPQRFDSMSKMYSRIGKRALAARRTREGILFAQGLSGK